MSKSITGQFLDFCRSKPADEEYDYCSNGGCAFAKFLIDAGYSQDPRVGAWSWEDNQGTTHRMSRGLSRALSRVDTSLPHLGRTFGALADRLAALQSVKEG